MDEKETNETTPPEQAEEKDGRSLVDRLTHLPIDLAGGMASGAVKLVSKTGSASLQLGRALLTPERIQLMRETGAYLKDVREVTGLTLSELSNALDLEDKSLLEAVEKGTATLSFELILRLAALLARHDPIPFVMRLARTYNPTVWRILSDWGVGNLPLQYERERQFVNIYRRHDAARQLSDAGFNRVLDFTRGAFDMALRFAADEEGIEDKNLDI